MEFIFAILVYIAAAWVIGAIFGAIGRLFRAGAGAVASSIGNGSNNSRFQLRITPHSRQIAGTTFQLLKAEIIGPVQLPRDNCRCGVALHATDVTDGQEKPVLCAIDELQDALTTGFEFSTDDLTLPYRHTLISEWTPIVDIPAEALFFPRSGLREIRFRLDIYLAGTPVMFLLGMPVGGQEGILATAYATVSYPASQPGYDEQREKTERVEELTVRLAMAVSAADGSLDVSEGEIIRSWLQKRLGRISSEERQQEEKARYNGYVQRAYDDALNGRISKEEIADEMKEIASPAQKYDAIELCMSVAGADETADKTELEFIRDLARRMDVNMDRIRSMEEKILPVSIHAEIDDSDALLGISSDMEPGEIRRHLNREYRKWNDRQSSRDPAVREEAMRMLKIIAEARRKYVG